MTNSMRLADIILAIFIAGMWGLTFVATKVGLTSFPPLLFASLRFAVASVPLVAFIGRPDVGWRWVLGVGLTLGTCQFGFLFLGINAGLPAGLASLVLQSQVPFTTVLALVVLKDTPSARKRLVSHAA